MYGDLLQLQQLIAPLVGKLEPIRLVEMKAENMENIFETKFVFVTIVLEEIIRIEKK